MVANDKLLEVQADASYFYVHLRRPLADAANLSSSAQIADHACTATRTATRLLQDSTQWTNCLARSTENRISKRNFRTHQYRLERTQANS